MSDHLNVRKTSYTIPVEVDDDGTPLCPCIMCRGDRQRMIPTGDGEWSCPQWVPIQQVINQAVRDFEHVDPPTSGE